MFLFHHQYMFQYNQLIFNLQTVKEKSADTHDC